MARIISVITQKGGVGKTTTVNALAATLNKLGRRVLAIDMDPQGNLSFSLGAETEDVRTIYDVIRKEMNALDCIQRCNTSDVIPSDILLSSIELDYTGKNREFLLREALGDVKKSLRLHSHRFTSESRCSDSKCACCQQIRYYAYAS
ncbi:AAA family ATPase [Ruminococcus sp. HUN007]|uniref:ParA family protein n=1 Tax=Ruminococcus sp. HUN007 TaxID=1514668 RepID=UPI000A579DD4|nr:AAA family ATPase [Ruminococcus sp. HUN007]